MSATILVWQAQHEFAKRLERCLLQYDREIEIFQYDEEADHPSSNEPLTDINLAFISTTALRQFEERSVAWARLSSIPVVWVGTSSQGFYTKYSPSESLVLPAYFNCVTVQNALRHSLEKVADRSGDEIIESGASVASATVSMGADRPEGDSDFIYAAPCMQQLIANAKIYGALSVSVLIRGASGTGKEYIARLVAASHPTFGKGNFVPVNCAAIPDTLFESLFFGHRRGAFTGAVRDHNGFFHDASNGTLYLDEIGDLPRFQQVKLLRALEDSVIHPVGSNDPVKLNLRLISATNRPLQRMIDDGSFRVDFYHRIGVVELYVPTLEERGRAEKLLLFQHAFAMAIRKYGGHLDLPTPELPVWLQEWVTCYIFEGNVRELVNKAARVAAFYLGYRHLNQSECMQVLDIKDPYIDHCESTSKNVPDFASRSDERYQVLDALESNHWRRSETAEALGWSRKTLWLKMKKYGLSD